LWALVWLALIDPFCFYESKSWCVQFSDLSLDIWLRLAGIVFGIPLVSLFLGWVILRAIAGLGLKAKRP